MNVYPSTEELIPPVLRAKLPASLIEEIAERYESLGEKYVTHHIAPDGRRVNGMMYTDRMLNCREEIVDAVFCILGQIFKENVAGNDPDDNFYILLMGLIEIYSSIVFIEHNGEYVETVEPEGVI